MNAPELRTISIAAATIELAPGEHYAGIAFIGKVPSHHLVLLPGDKALPWEKAKEWAKEQDGELPTRSEQALLYANVKDEFEGDWYWSSEQLASVPSYAWMQDFSNGGQTYGHTSFKHRARAVRRVPIQ